LNGLWRWQPAASDGVPDGGWGWFKVPGCWPGITDYMQKDCQTVFPNPAWKSKEYRGITAAWYQREFSVPASWKGRKIAIQAAYVNSLATVFVDGKQAGSIKFPAGEMDITGFVQPGSKHLLSIEAVALPLKAVMLSYTDTNHARQMQATVQRRGLCGDVFLASSPAGPELGDVRVDTSFRKGSVSVAAKTSGLNPGNQYTLRGKILDQGKVVHAFIAGPFAGADALACSTTWKPAKLWDLNTPQNQYDFELTLLDARGKVLDVQAPKRFGFRELWIDGRDFILNGTRIFWSCVPVENAGISAGVSSYAGAKETFRRLKQIGVNMVYTHNYSCNPGEYMAFDEILRAADDEGVLVALTMPHFSDYDWSAPDADRNNGYARHAAFFAQVAANHPSVIAYSTSHNATGYNEDTNPDMIDGSEVHRDNWSSNNVKKALRAQAIIESIDPSRIVYHHSSGNLGTMHTMNFYMNFVPIQEMDDWYEHWATQGVKPAFMVEYGVPFSWDWSLYRGWYNGERSFGNAQVPWEVTMAEWNAQFLGDRAYKVSEGEKRNLRWEAQRLKAGQVFFRWDYPLPMGSTNPDFDDGQEVWARYTADNWRAFRTWGVSGTSPWETSGTFWRLRDGVNRGRVELKTDWDHLQRPGYCPDYVDGRYDRRDVAYDEADWVPTIGGESLLRNNGSVLAYIGGKPEAFTDKTHIFRPGEQFQKQLILINNSRSPVTCYWGRFAPLDGPRHQGNVLIPRPIEAPTNTLNLSTGQISRIPVTVQASQTPGQYGKEIDVIFGPLGSQKDEFRFTVMPPIPSVKRLRALAVFDPKGETTKALAALGVTGTPISVGDNLSMFDTLIIGKGALSPDGPGPDLSRVRQGLRVLMFEQTSETLEQRFGFRVEEYGLRNVIRRVPDHPALRGLDEETLRDWRGSATILPPRRPYVLADKWDGAPSSMVNGFLEPRVWRCGTRGNVASVLIEKPAVGNFLPIIDGGYSLQYSPLMEYREGKGVILFCQMDVTGRTESDPAAEVLTVNLLNYLGSWQPSAERSIVYAGDPAGKRYLKDAGYPVSDFEGSVSRGLLVIGPGGDAALESQSGAINSWLGNGGSAIAIGLDSGALFAGLNFKEATERREYINSTFDPAPADSPLAGIGPADLYNRDPRPVPVFAGNRVLDTAFDGNLTMFQLVPWEFDTSKINTKRVFRHTSVALARLLGNYGVHAPTPLLSRFSSPAKRDEQRWLKGFYLDTPVMEDDPYRFFGW